jgi:hypothetical protein
MKHASTLLFSLAFAVAVVLTASCRREETLRER